MARGRKPTPAHINNLHGNPGKRGPRSTLPGPAVGEPRMPTWLGKAAKAEWRRIVPQLLAMGILTVVDGACLACYCLAVEELQEASEMLTRDGWTCHGKRGVVVAHPAVRMLATAMAAVKAFGAIFGLNPAARRGWLDGNQDTKELDPLAVFLCSDDGPKAG